MQLQGKIALITGSSSGIGRTTALEFAKAGATVIVHYRGNKAGGEETLAEVQKSSPESILLQADITDVQSVASLFSSIESKFGKLDVLVNNAAIPKDKVPFLEASFDDIYNIINADLIGPMICAQHAVKLMQKNGSGKILNTSSIRGIEYGGRSVVYAASKAAINSFTKTLAKQVAPGIQVNAVAPGFVKTRVYDDISSEQQEDFLDQTYLKRWVKEEEIADAFLFLARNDAMTGQIIYVDAGFTLK